VLPTALRVVAPPPRFFEMMTMANPLGALCQDPEAVAALTPAERTDLEAVLGRPLGEAAKAYDPFSSNPLFFHPSFAREPAPGLYTAVRGVLARRLVLERPDLLAADRSRMFVRLIWAPAYRRWDEGRHYPHIRTQVPAVGWVVTGVPAGPGLRRWAEAVEAAAEATPHLYWNSTPALLLLAGVAAARRRLPRSALFAGLFLVQVPLLFLATPSAYFKYVHFLYVAPFVLVPLVALEVRDRRAGAVA
jgi:hypothetical protein